MGAPNGDGTPNATTSKNPPPKEQDRSVSKLTNAERERLVDAYLRLCASDREGRASPSSSQADPKALPEVYPDSYFVWDATQLLDLGPGGDFRPSHPLFAVPDLPEDLGELAAREIFEKFRRHGIDLVHLRECDDCRADWPATLERILPSWEDPPTEGWSHGLHLRHISHCSTCAKWRGPFVCRRDGLDVKHILGCSSCLQQVARTPPSVSHGFAILPFFCHSSFRHLVDCVHCRSLIPVLRDTLGLATPEDGFEHRTSCQDCQDRTVEIEELNRERPASATLPSWMLPGGSSRHGSGPKILPSEPPKHKTVFRTRNGKTTAEDIWEYEWGTVNSRTGVKRSRKRKQSDD